MSRQTTNYGYNISEGSDLVNPLIDIFPNWEAIDGDLKDVSDDTVGRATELTTGTVHALTRSDTDRDVFVFTATSNFTAGDTFTLDGTQVSALTPAGEQLATGCYIIGSDVLVAVHGTLMTMYVSPTKVADSDKLDGHDSTYFATASDVSDLSDDLDAVSNKVGTGVLTTTAQDCVSAINELNSDLSVIDISSSVTFVNGNNSCKALLKKATNTIKIHFESFSQVASGAVYIMIPNTYRVKNQNVYAGQYTTDNINRKMLASIVTNNSVQCSFESGVTAYIYADYELELE